MALQTAKNQFIGHLDPTPPPVPPPETVITPCGDLWPRPYYLENGLVVEHSESTVGQARRDESYFKRTRNWFKKPDSPE